MLGTLRKIVQEVNAAKDLKAALGIIVLRVREAMGSQVRAFPTLASARR